MKIVVFGASGGTGLRIVEQALEVGHVVKAFVRSPSKMGAQDANLTIARFPRLMDGTHTGKYRVGYVGKDSGSQLARADAADFVLKELAEKQWLRKLPLVSY